MYNDTFMELNEAVYFFSMINSNAEGPLTITLDDPTVKKLGMTASVIKAMMRILVVSRMIDHKTGSYLLTDEQSEKHKQILENIQSRNQKHHFDAFYDKALNRSQFFFNDLSNAEYEIYSKCNFPITRKTGTRISEHIDLSNKKVLELGGNSGGLGTALVEQYEDCSYTIVDTEIPCKVGNEYKRLNEVDMTFIEGDIFDLELPCEIYDYVILMNLLHDFDDEKCVRILNSCKGYLGAKTKFIIIEDILINEFEPKEAVMHGLRLSVECRGGKQRTLEEFSNLFSSIGYKLDYSIRVDSVHGMLMMRLETEVY
ncbi:MULTISPECIES: methyltransferase [unclassified Fusibacter]|uniref:methyltransferase n=1 Tax=unclassified Fusibacter TaxID=2624464 RepID=UPI001010168D|nr:MULTISPECIES: methyltransferase [unclassified Fusibacter]MCK8060296.1 methyltransferase domain-containing protein [Fusibacter sp. A2]NPE20415.1 methyltransferase domain-containing protein [Fusibacter sp. A1]RXV63620.1 methyltransferase domain-containing protein [Fusibacter sp. A1]